MHIRRSLVAGLLALLVAPFASAQTEPGMRWLLEPAGERREGGEIETDRDSFTPAVSTVGRGRLVFESAYSFIDNRGVKETHSFPEALFRYGLTERLELRLGGNYEVGGAGSEVSSSGNGEGDASRSKLERSSNFSYGLKYNVNEQRGWLPASSLILQGFTPSSGEEKATRFTGTCVFGWELPERWKLDAAFRCRTDGEKGDNFTTWAPSVVLKVPIGERINVHAEYFGLFSQDKQSDFVKHFVSPGIHYLVSENVEVGVRVGWGLNDQAARFFANVGFGVRF